MYALNLSEDYRILSAAPEEYAAPGQPIVAELPEGDIHDYLYVDGAYVYDPLPRPEPPAHESADAILNALLGVEA